MILAHTIQGEIEKDDVITFRGYGFSYHATGSVKGGTVTSFYEDYQGLKLFTLTGLKVSVTALYGRGGACGYNPDWMALRSRKRIFIRSANSV